MNVNEQDRAFFREQLRRPPRFADGVLRVKYPTERYDLREPTVAHVRAGGFTDEPAPLETLHKRVRPEHQVWNPSCNAVDDDNICITSPAFRETYRQLVKYLAREVLGYDCVFEQTPNLRFHFPVRLPDRFRSRDGHVLAYHTDTFFDPFEQINCWLPLSSCFGVNAMHWSSLASGIEILDQFCAGIGYDERTYKSTGRQRFFDAMNDDRAFMEKVCAACSPLSANFGEVILFDGRIVHGTMENTDDHTRVSLDFRILPLDDYEAIVRRYQARGEPLPIEGVEELPISRGGFYEAQTAFEI